MRLFALFSSFSVLAGGISCSSHLSDKEATRIFYMTEGYCEAGRYEEAKSEAKKIPPSSPFHPKALKWIEIIEELENNPEKYACDYWRGSPKQQLIARKLSEF